MRKLLFILFVLFSLISYSQEDSVFINKKNKCLEIHKYYGKTIICINKASLSYLEGVCSDSLLCFTLHIVSKDDGWCQRSICGNTIDDTTKNLLTTKSIKTTKLELYGFSMVKNGNKNLLPQTFEIIIAIKPALWRRFWLTRKVGYLFVPNR